MQKKYLFIIIFLFFLLPAEKGAAVEMEDLKNMDLYGGTIEEVDIDASNSNSSLHYAYARVPSPPGLYKSVVPGNSLAAADVVWTKLDTSSYFITATSMGITQDNSQLFATANGSSLYSSTDGGLTWTADSNIQNGSSIEVPASNTIFLVANDTNDSSKRNVFYSSDHGENWNTILDTPLADIYTIGVSNDDNNSYVWLAINSSGTVYRLARSEDTWTSTSFDLSETVTDFVPIWITVDPSDSNIVYFASNEIVGSGKTVLLKTINATASDPNFTQLENETDTNGRVYVSPTDSSLLYKSMKKSTDGGDSWSVLAQPITGLNINYVRALHPTNADIVYASTNQGVAVSQDAFTTVTEIDTGISAVQIQGAVQAINDTDIMVIVSRSGIARSTDGGTSWNFEIHGAPWQSIASNSSGRIYAGGASSDLYYSDDQGDNWTQTGLRAQRSQVDGYDTLSLDQLFIDPNNESIIYVSAASPDGSTGALYQGNASDFSSGQWTQLISSTPVNCVNGYASGSSTVLFAGYGDITEIGTIDTTGLKMSTDSGSTWTEVSALNGYLPRWITVSSGNSNIIFVGTGHLETNTLQDESGTIFRSADGGSSWTNVSPNYDNPGPITCIVVDPADSDKVYATCNNIIYSSLDAGETWEEYYIADDGQVFSSVFMFQGLLYTAAAAAARAGERNATPLEQSTEYSLVLGAQTGLYLWGSSTEWYFAEGCTVGDFDTWLLIANPSVYTATVTATYYTTESSSQQQYTVGPTSRYSIHLNAIDGLSATDVSTKLSADNPIICERAMYWQNMAKGHDTIGATATANTWYFGEGCTDGYDTWILLMNPGTTVANVALTFMKGDSTTVLQTETVGAGRRRSVNVGTISGMEDVEFSTKVESDNPIVSERAMYWNNTGGAELETSLGGHCTVGTSAPSSSWYLTEGYTGGTYDTWVLIQNPNSSSASCAITFYTNNGSPRNQQLIVGPNSRSTIHVDDTLADHEVSTYINAGTSQVIAERAMYWGEGNNADGHCTMGIKTLSSAWSLAEGCTAGDFEEYILLLNPNRTEATVTISYLKTDGTTVAGSYTVSGQSRYTIHPDDITGLESTSFSATISSNIPIAVERAMYIGTTGGHCSRGMKQ